MIAASSLVVGVLFAVSFYLMLGRNSQRVAFGFILLSNAVNLLVLTAAGLPERPMAPIVRPGVGEYVDPLPQAFLLTAIVIGLGSAALLLALAARLERARGADEAAR